MCYWALSCCTSDLQNYCMQPPMLCSLLWRRDCCTMPQVADTLTPFSTAGRMKLQSGTTLALRSQSSGIAALNSCRLSTSLNAGVAAPFVPTKTVRMLHACAPEMFLVLSSKNIMSSGLRPGSFCAAWARASSNACSRRYLRSTSFGKTSCLCFLSLLSAP